MSRIRSIKPQFWRDEKIASLKNKLAGYMFIGLWNIADDEGKFQLSPKSIALELPIFRTKEVEIYLEELSQKGLIQKSECSQWGLITNWDHQKISHPQVPKVKKKDIQWVTDSSYRNTPENSRTLHADRIGKDRNTLLRNVAQTSSDAKVEKIKSSKIKKDKANLLPIPSNAQETNKEAALFDLKSKDEVRVNYVVAAYCEAYKTRYGASPFIDPKHAGNLKKALQGKSTELGVKLVQVYVQMDDKFFITKKHDLGTFLQNITKVYVALQTGIDDDADPLKKWAMQMSKQEVLE